MNWINKLERKIGKYAIHNLMYYIIILYGVGFVLNMISPTFYAVFLSLNPQAIMHGQVWRIVTFLIQPPSNSLIFIIFALYLYYMIGIQLERQWGAFRFNLYFFTGVLLHIITSILIYVVTGNVFLLDTTYLNLSLFFAFAATYPDMQFLLFFLVPVKVKWLAVFDGALFVYSIIQSIAFHNYATAIAAIISIANFLLFFFSTRNYKRVSPKEINRKRTYHKEVHNAQGITKHKCAVCGKTELDGDNLEFRFCSKCDGNYEYCQDHLFTHQHVKK